ncbi:dopamine receptor 2-like [Antedon mediterranea]|uniref:dopamine receptor 2-like n=1 Tax=Antedon mediterranea TaxID=105859 RepID=UPI003AF6FAD6
MRSETVGTSTTINITSTEDVAPILRSSSLLYIFLIIDFITILGNLLVIVAVFRNHRLHSTTNLLIASLALADFLIGVVVLPTAISLEYSSGYWYFGRIWCDIWHAIDVFCCTASISNLCIISFDRYWAITRTMTYRFKMTKRVSCFLIAFVWVSASTISFPWLILWRKVDPPFVVNQCIFTSNSLFIFVSSLISFYLPCIIMTFIYLRIYLRIYLTVLKQQIQGILTGTKSVMTSTKKSDKHRKPVNLRIHYGGTLKKNRLTNTMKTEHKAAKVLGIVMGIFIVCWLPFFVTNVLSALCIKCIKYPGHIFPIVSWLGWLNSTVNPLIYAFVSKQFRQAFRDILFGSFCRTKSSPSSSVITTLSKGVINATFIDGDEDLKLSTYKYS